MSFQTPILPENRTKGASRSQMNKRAMLTIALLIFFALFWLGIGLLQVALAVSEPDNSRLFTLGLGLWNIVMAFSMVWATRGVRHRYQTMPRDLGIFVIVGVILAILGIVSGAWFMACIIPAYVMLGVLVMVNRDVYTEPKPSKQKNQVG